MSTPNASHVLQQVFILATGHAAPAGLLAEFEAVVAADGHYGRVAAAFEVAMGQMSASRGVGGTVQQLALNSLGVVLSADEGLAVARLAQEQGLTTWARLMDFLVSADFGIYNALDHRAEAANAFNSALASQNKGALFAGVGVETAVHTLLQGIGATDASAATGISGVQALAGRLTAAGIQGHVADGYVKGATVFADANGNHRLDAGEWSATTDGAGGFTLPASVQGTMVATGGTDLLTNKAFKGMLTAPVGSTVVNPITTLVQALMDKGGATTTVEQATALLAKVLNLPAGIHLLTYDPLAVLASSSASAAEKAVALGYQKVAVALVNVVSIGAAALDAAEAKAGQPGVATPHAGQAGAAAGTLIASLADALAGAAGEPAAWRTCRTPPSCVPSWRMPRATMACGWMPAAWTSSARWWMPPTMRSALPPRWRCWARCPQRPRMRQVRWPRATSRRRPMVSRALPSRRWCSSRPWVNWRLGCPPARAATRHRHPVVVMPAAVRQALWTPRPRC